MSERRVSLQNISAIPTMLSVALVATACQSQRPVEAAVTQNCAQIVAGSYELQQGEGCSLKSDGSVIITRCDGTRIAGELSSSGLMLQIVSRPAVSATLPPETLPSVGASGNTVQILPANETINVGPFNYLTDEARYAIDVNEVDRLLVDSGAKGQTLKIGWDHEAYIQEAYNQFSPVQAITFNPFEIGENDTFLILLNCNPNVLSIHGAGIEDCEFAIKHELGHVTTQIETPDYWLDTEPHADEFAEEHMQNYQILKP